MKFKRLFQKVFLSYVEKTKLFSYEHREYILKDFKSHIEKIIFFLWT